MEAAIALAPDASIQVADDAPDTTERRWSVSPSQDGTHWVTARLVSWSTTALLGWHYKELSNGSLILLAAHFSAKIATQHLGGLFSRGAARRYGSAIGKLNMMRIMPYLDIGENLQDVYKDADESQSGKGRRVLQQPDPRLYGRQDPHWPRCRLQLGQRAAGDAMSFMDMAGGFAGTILTSTTVPHRTCWQTPPTSQRPTQGRYSQLQCATAVVSWRASTGVGQSAMGTGNTNSEVEQA